MLDSVKKEVEQIIKKYNLNCSVEEFREKVFLHCISQYQTLSEDFISEFKDEVKMHKKRSPLSGKIVRIKKGVKHFQVPDFEGSEFHVEDWWDHLTGKSWTDPDNMGNPAYIVYGMRISCANCSTPHDNEVLYGKIGHFGHLVHISEIEEIE